MIWRENVAVVGRNALRELILGHAPDVRFIE